MYVTHTFSLDHRFISELRKMTPQFGFDGFGEFVFYRTYSRRLPNDTQEKWADVVIRVIEGIMSIRKNHYIRNFIPWDDIAWQKYAQDMSLSLFKMHWLPPGRGLWAMGTRYVYERGSMALYNCAYVNLKGSDLPNALHWMMDCLMCGVGVGFGAYPESNFVVFENKNKTSTYVIPDSKEGWCDSVKMLVESYMYPDSANPVFDYSKIRKRGEPIKGFGGIASGYEVLEKLHIQMRQVFTDYMHGKISSSRLKVDLANLIGCCVISGNVRRTAEIALGSIHDNDFLNLKDYTLNPDRESFGWTSNNSVTLNNSSDFRLLSQVAKRVVKNGEPGFVNLSNFKLGRIRIGDNSLPDRAIGINPCGEIPLENYETCNLAETCPTRCNPTEWMNACSYATFYCSTVALLPTHRPETNNVVCRNRRIGVGIMDVSGWKEKLGASALTTMLNDGYNVVKNVNAKLAAEAGVPASIRLTTIKPGGTVPKIAGVTSGIGHPTSKFTLRRVRVADNSKMNDLLISSGVPYEKDVYSEHTNVFSFPIIQGPARPAKEVTLWEQACNVVLMQSEWADNAVSNTLYFQEHERKDIESVLAFLAPKVKSVSLLPMDNSSYPQMPEEEITEEQYNTLPKIKIDWNKLSGSDGIDEKYCSGDTCEIIRK